MYQKFRTVAAWVFVFPCTQIYFSCPPLYRTHLELQAGGLALDPTDDDLGSVLGDDFIVMEHSEFWGELLAGTPDG
jgi:hypothetical protein